MATYRPAATRRTDLDLLRIIVCGGVILAHALLIFAAEPRYHVKSAAPWLPATIFYEAFRISTLAIFFVLAGWSAVASLRRRPWQRYLRDRAERVLLPLVAGVVLLGPVIKWIELGQGRDLRINGFRLVTPPDYGFVEFLSRYFGRVQLLTWSHLWFLAYLFVISLALLPVLLRLARVPRREWMPGRVLAFLPAAGFALLILTTGAYWPFLPNLTQDWGNLLYFTACFLAGGVFAAWPGWEARLRAEAPWLLAMALAGLAIVLLAGEGVVGRIGVGLCAWGSIGAALGYAGRHPPSPSPLLAWLGEATMPVYVLHHVPVLALGVLALGWGWGPMATVLFAWPLATLLSLAAYRLLVQPFAWPRRLVGMGPAPQPPKTAPGLGGGIFRPDGVA
ncbi:acyltransferase [Siccirubricoccus sp. KC 17139]|uniref:Acyltransferase n=1 Tax=Siccirubricoccus soli TaxID=2899147 RepID=A0ABT1D5Z5_9PROT|nr:acyltransferase [Siccirubricoccus soli]MCO6417032.1 acyltransferase [Siccirubricoccus soli]MCP2683167.1 acyltransferase [Siccirubricoccus soli]